MPDISNSPQNQPTQNNQPNADVHEPVQPAPDYSSTPPTIPLFSTYDLWFAQILILIILACLTGYIIFRLSFPNPALAVLREPGKPYEYVIDINEADWIHWMLLPGVGEKLAKKIIAYRTEHGPFLSIDDLLNVNGIGNITLDKLKPHLKCQSLVPAQSPPTK